MAAHDPGLGLKLALALIFIVLIYDDFELLFRSLIHNHHHLLRLMQLEWDQLRKLLTNSKHDLFINPISDVFQLWVSIEFFDGILLHGNLLALIKQFFSQLQSSLADSHERLLGWDYALDYIMNFLIWSSWAAKSHKVSLHLAQAVVVTVLYKFLQYSNIFNLNLLQDIP